MDKQFFTRQFAIAVACLLLAVVLFDFTSIDLWVQQKLYRPDVGQWILDKQDPTLRMLFYDGPKSLLTLLAKVVLLVLIVFRRNELLGKYRSGLLIVLVSTLVTVALVGVLKSLTNVPCPKDLSLFGADHPYVTFLHRLPLVDTLPRVRCFPAGHASGGFALLSLFFLFRRRRNQWIGFAVGMTLGWILGIYKMLIGDHFLSHTVVTMCLGWLVSLSVAACVYRCSMQSATRLEPSTGETEAESVR
ncbi:phosphatase PAP2 family protein [uncultured Microbulbifer sp.]|uniref:phosphatase PAP2 family protein n=1 Tax=uncultured Microbulbifer sp. TaxID=348147 RepID=UPI0025D089C1|nr:phosphatase PAP2 family protein [uncultured Microbulbifer sp.]